MPNELLVELFCLFNAFFCRFIFFYKSLIRRNYCIEGVQMLLEAFKTSCRQDRGLLKPLPNSQDEDELKTSSLTYPTGPMLTWSSYSNPDVTELYRRVARRIYYIHIARESVAFYIGNNRNLE